jgi:hypothetical protein
MSELINMHKRIAMGGESEANHLKKGGKVAKYKNGGSVYQKGSIPTKEYSTQKADVKQWNDHGRVGSYPESKVQTLINDSSNKQPYLEPKVHSIATHKKGGMAKAPKKGLMIAIAIGKPKKGTKNY